MRHLIWAIVGALIGAILAFAGTFAITAVSIALSPDDKSAGSVGIIIIGLLPIGLIAGAVVGVARSRRKP